MIAGMNLVQVLSDAESVSGQQFADFHQRCFAEVLPGQQFLLADFGQITERIDVHRLQAITAADGQFEVRDRSTKQLLHAGFSASLVLVVVHALSRIDVSQIELSELVIGIVFTDSAEAERRSLIVFTVLVQQAQIQHGSDKERRLGQRSFVQPDGLFVVASKRILSGQPEEGS